MGRNGETTAARSGSVLGDGDLGLGKKLPNAIGRRELKREGDGGVLIPLIVEGQVPGAEPLYEDLRSIGPGQRNGLPAGFAEPFADWNVFAEQGTIAVVEFRSSKVMAGGRIGTEEAGEHPVSYGPLHVAFDFLVGKSAEIRVHQKTKRFGPAEGATVKKLFVAHRVPAAAGVPIGFGPHHIQPRGQPAESGGGSIGHHEFPHSVDVSGNGPDVFKGDQATEDCRPPAV